jgi:polysaccharide deacetylase family protein (PEP-CTERM system associated)
VNDVANLPDLTYVASFDVEEHHRIEAAAGLDVPRETRAEYGRRVETTTHGILEQLADAGAKATFFVVGSLAETHPALVRAIHDEGHEVASHSWEHRRVHHFDRASFREDLLHSKEALEDVTGTAVVGFRAPTFSILRETAWAIDVLAACGFEYDSSIFPVRHDRYGIPDAPRGPFFACGEEAEILEFPLLTYRLGGFNLPVAGGGYFRLFPPALMRAGIRQAGRSTPPAVAMLYFHPWEFDPDQPRLPLRGLSRWRTYVGMKGTTKRLGDLLGAYPFRRAVDVARDIRAAGPALPRFPLVAAELAKAA